MALVRVHLDARAGLSFVGGLGVEARAVAGEGRDVEVHAVRGDVGVPLVEETLDELDHLRNVIGRLRHHFRIEDVQLVPVDDELFRVGRREVQRVLPLALRRDLHLVFRLVDVVDGVTDVGDVHHLLHFETEVLERPAYDVRHDVAVEVPDVLPVVDRRSAVVHADPTRPKRLERPDRS